MNKKMYFNTPSFHRGANVTIRLGKKWDGYRGYIELCQSKDRAKVGDAIVVNTQRKKFCDLEKSDVRLQHNPHCTDLEFLREEMERIYEDKFKEDAVVTIVTFVIDDGALVANTIF